MIYLTARESSEIKFEKFKAYSNEIIEYAKQLRNKNKKAIELLHESVKFKNYCGVISTENVTIEILPKIGYEEISNEQAKGLLISLLLATRQITLPVGNANLNWQSRHLLDIFVESFCNEVRQAMQRGMITDYMQQTENLNAIRGRLYLVEHLRQNAFNKSQLFCVYDERRVDNAYNRILKFVLHNLLKYPLSSATKNSVMSILHRFAGIADKPATASDLKALSFNRTNNHWASIFKKAEYFLKRKFPDIRSGAKDGSAFLFDMPKLFENALGEKIKKISDMQVSLQDSGKSLATNGNFSLTPDIVVRNDNDVFSILDAKWKNPYNQGELEISPADIYQMNTYADRYRCQKIALIFPAVKNSQAETISFSFDTKQNPTLHIITVDIATLVNDEPLSEHFNELIFQNNSK